SELQFAATDLVRIHKNWIDRERSVMVVWSEPDRDLAAVAQNVSCRYLTFPLKNSGRLEIEGSEGGIDANTAISVDCSAISALHTDAYVLWMCACLNQQVILEMLARAVEQGVDAWIEPTHCHLRVLREGCRVLAAEI